MDDRIIWEIIGVFLLSSLVTILRQLRNDISRINVTLNKIAKQIGVSDKAAETVDTEVYRLLSEGKRIQAIKRYRQLTGLGLKESKEYIDSLERQR